MTGYGLAFPVNSKHRSKFNEMLLEYRENGDLERLSRYWLHGVCKPNMQEKRASEPLSIDQFLSAFLLLILGKIIIITVQEPCCATDHPTHGSLPHEQDCTDDCSSCPSRW